MSKKYEREQRIMERLTRENRELKQEVKSLRNSIRKLNRGVNKLVDDEVIKEKDLPEAAKKICFECCVGEMVKINLLGRSWRQCDSCTRRTKTKFDGK